MSVAVLVRHAQASFAADDYDLLSELGEAQATLLGTHWLHQRVRFDEIYCGPRRRHRQTSEAVASCFRRSERAWPDVKESSEFDEYDLDGLSRFVAPDLAKKDQEFADLLARYRQSAGEPDRTRNFQRMFERLMSHWITVDALPHGAESWPAFVDRVRKAIQRLQSHCPRGRRVVVFTSGGFIAAAAGLALDIGSRNILNLSYRLRNASITEFVFDEKRWTLDSFNGTPHLAESLLTFR